MACGSSWMRDQTRATAATMATAVTMLDPSGTAPQANSRISLFLMNLEFGRIACFLERPSTGICWMFPCDQVGVTCGSEEKGLRGSFHPSWKVPSVNTACAYRCWPWWPGWGPAARRPHCQAAFPSSLRPSSASLKGWGSLPLPWRQSSYVNYLFMVEDLSIPPHLFIYSLAYLYSYGLMDIYCIPCYSYLFSCFGYWVLFQLVPVSFWYYEVF